MKTIGHRILYVAREPTVLKKFFKLIHKLWCSSHLEVGIYVLFYLIRPSLGTHWKPISMQEKWCYMTSEDKSKKIRQFCFQVVLLGHPPLEPWTGIKLSNHTDTTIQEAQATQRGHMKRPQLMSQKTDSITTRHMSKGDSRWFWSPAVTSPSIIKPP